MTHPRPAAVGDITIAFPNTCIESAAPVPTTTTTAPTTTTTAPPATTTTTASTTTQPASDPALPATGQDSTPMLALAAGVALTGTVVSFFARRRRSQAS